MTTSKTRRIRGQWQQQLQPRRRTELDGRRSGSAMPSKTAQATEEEEGQENQKKTALPAASATVNTTTSTSSRSSHQSPARLECNLPKKHAPSTRFRAILHCVSTRLLNAWQSIFPTPRNAPRSCGKTSINSFPPTRDGSYSPPLPHPRPRRPRPPPSPSPHPPLPLLVRLPIGQPDVPLLLSIRRRTEQWQQRQQLQHQQQLQREVGEEEKEGKEQKGEVPQQ